MKRRIIALLVMCILAISLFACGKRSLKGTKWALTEGEYQGIKVEASQLGDDAALLEFKSSDEVLVSFEGDESERSKYTLDGKKLTIMGKGANQKLTGTLDGDRLTFDYQGVKMIFTKQ